jgi:hypothetical protein
METTQVPPPGISAAPTDEDFHHCHYRTVRKRKEQQAGRLCGRRAQFSYGSDGGWYCWPHYKHLIAVHEKRKQFASSVPSTTIEPSEKQEPETEELPLSDPPKKPRIEVQEEKQECEETEPTQPYDWVEELASGNLWDSLHEVLYENLRGKVS